MIEYSTFKEKINDFLKDAYFSSNHVEELKRATNMALDDINVGETGEPGDKEVAYNFQREQEDISFIKDTYDYTFTTSNFKFPADLRVDSDEDETFSETDANYFFRKKGRFSSSEKMYAFIYNGNTLTIKINHHTTETLNFDFYSTDMVLDKDNSTRKSEIENDSDQFLIPERYINVLIELTSAYLYYQLKGLNSKDYILHLKEGRNRLKRMIASIGIYRKKSVIRPMIRGEQKQTLRRLSTR
jgi:hypothetical protein